MRTLAFLLIALPAAAGTMYEDRRAGVAFSAPDGWIEVPTPPVPEGAESDADATVIPVVRYEAAEPASDGTLSRFDVVLIRDGDPAAAFEKWAGDTWKDFEITDRRDLGGGKAFTATISGGHAYGAVMTSGKRAAGLLLVGGPDSKDASLIAATGTWVFSDPDPAAPLRVPPGWKATETQHYRIRYQGDDDTAREVGRHLEAVSAEMRRILPLETPGAPRRSLDVRLFRNNREFQAYATANGVEGAEAYFSPAQNELVAHMDEKSPDLTFHILYHEATHQYLRDVLGRKTHLPIWLDEGLAEYFFPGSFGSGGRFSLSLNDGRLAEARRAFAHGHPPGLAEMMSMKRDDFYDLEGGYALGWSVVHFLLTDPRYRGAIPAWLTALRDTGSPDKARDKALENTTFEALERDWRKWVTEE